jgi:hypothetical protein
MHPVVIHPDGRLVAGDSQRGSVDGYGNKRAGSYDGQDLEILLRRVARAQEHSGQLAICLSASVGQPNGNGTCLTRTAIISRVVTTPTKQGSGRG